MDASEKNNSKTIATIDVNLIPSVDKRTWIEESVNEHFHCVLCGSELDIHHKTDFITQEVQEEAHCPSCNIRNRQSAYSLQ